MQNYDHSALIKKLMDCALACENCATACLLEQNIKDMTQCISLDRDCADICGLAAKLLQRNSEIGHQYLLICEEICRMCGDECDKHDHEHCQRCADACYDCAEACHAHHEPVMQN